MGNDPRTWVSPQYRTRRPSPLRTAEDDVRAALGGEILGIDVERELGKQRAARYGFEPKKSQMEELADSLEKQGFDDPWNLARTLIKVSGAEA